MPNRPLPEPARSWLTTVFYPLWRRNPEIFWPYGARPVAARIHTWIAPSYAYGAARVPAEGGMVIASNHLSAIDPTLVGGYCPRTIFNMAKVELLAIPVAGEILQWTGAFPVRRGEGDREALRLARDLVAGGHAVGVFLEGHRQPFGYPGSVLPGGLMIAMQEGVPVIPVGLDSFGWSPRNRRRCCVVYGEPMRFDHLPRSGKGYKQAADVLGAEVLRLWRMACEAVAAGFPPELPDGARRTGKYPDFRRSGPR